MMIDLTDIDPIFARESEKQLNNLLVKYPMIRKQIKWVSSFARRNKAFLSWKIEEQVRLALTDLKNKNRDRPVGFTDDCVNQLRSETTLKWVGLYDYKDRWAQSMDFTWGPQQGIAFNEKLNHKHIKRVQEQSVIEGFHARGNKEINSIVTHEFAHHMYRWLLNHELFNETIGIFWNETTRKVNRIDTKKDQNRFWKEKISLYAGRNIEEFFAECFTEYIHNPKCRELARQVGENLDSIMATHGLSEK
ncbi:MAG: hypothetical protein ABFD50_05160 [Smithella sp.]